MATPVVVTTRVLVEVRLAVPGFHAWPEAPQDSPIGFLASKHRHTFHIRARIAVAHQDRDLEFIMLKRQIHGHLESSCVRAPSGGFEFGSMSCEMLATELLHYLRNCGFRVTEVGVSEDNEFEGIVQVG
jgi:hypothetical protein